MKKIVFTLLLASVSVCGFAQNKLRLSHFWDIPWGTSIENAQAILDERNLPSSRDENCLITHGKYEREDSTIILMFNRANRLYCANVVYESSSSSVLSHYDKYRKVLYRRYGAPDTAVEYYAEPYKKGDGREIEAIETENAFHFTEWAFEDECLASVSILKNINICLTFKNPAYADSSIGKK